MTKSLTDQQLFELCQKYGAAALEARRRFLGLLPEVNRRGIWRGRGFGSIFEFAAKLAGVSEEQVRDILNLERKFDKLPILKAQLVNGEVSVSKLIRVASIATVENEVFWADQIRILSKSAVETLVRDEKLLRIGMPGQLALPEKSNTSKIELGATTVERLEKLRFKGIDIDEIINQALDRREAEIMKEKEAMAKEIETARAGKNSSDGNQPLRNIPGDKLLVKNSRYIPVRIRRLVQMEHGKKCAMDGCRREAKAIHHTRRFAMSGRHNPYYLAPLCRQHHEIAHKIDLKVLEYRKESGGAVLFDKSMINI